jgi:general secretion pathway protein E
VLAQRLLRVNCPHCAKRIKPDQTLIEESGISMEQAVNYNFMQGLGCGQCRGVGYKGRKVVGELLVLDDAIKELIVNREPISVIKEQARKKGMRFIREAALDLVKAGETTLEEINRVTFVG